MKKIFFSLFAVLLIIPQSFAQPDWFKNGSSRQYQPELYWVGVSSAAGKSGMEAAKEKAKAEIASQLKVTVSSKFSTSSTETMAGSNWNYSSDLKSTTESTVDKMELIGLSFAETYYSGQDNTSYVMAVLDKAQFLSALQKELDGLTEQATDRLDNIHKLQSSLDMSTAITKLIDLLSFVEPVYPKIIFFNSISEKTYELPKALVYDNIELELYSLLDNISLKIESGNNQKGRLGSFLADPLVINAVYNSEGKSFTLKGIPVVFKSENKTFEKTVTDENGTASFKCLLNADMIKTGNLAQVKAMISLPVLRGKLKDKLDRTALQDFEIQVEKNSFTCSVEVKGSGSDQAQLGILKKVVAALEKNGAMINQAEAAYHARVIISSSDAGTVDGMAGTMFMQNVEAAIVIMERQSGNVLGTINISSKGLDKNNKLAVDKGVSNLKVPAEKISEALGKINL